MTTNNTMLEAALGYVARGWAVFPLHRVDAGVCSCGQASCIGRDRGKHPVERLVPKGFKQSTTDPEKVREWWAQGEWNIGVRTGKASGITVFDIDIADGKVGAETWREACERAGGEPQTLVANTGSGGMHAVFKYNAAVKSATGWLGKDADTRGDGGYIVAPPSTHYSGGAYSWANDLPLEDVPEAFTHRAETRGRKKKDPLAGKHWSIEDLQDLLAYIRNDDRDRWRAVGIVLGRTLDRIEAGWKLYCEWSENRELGFNGQQGRNHSEIMHEAYYVLSAQEQDKPLTVGSLIKWAKVNGWAPKSGAGVPIDAFVYLAPKNGWVYRPTSDIWVAEAVNAATKQVNVNGQLVQPAEWVRMNVFASSMTTDPNIENDYLRGYDARKGELIRCEGGGVFNTYRRPTIEPGDARLAGKFLRHIDNIFRRNGDADQVLNYMAHLAQHPGTKRRFALLICGEQGTGKDTAIEMCLPAIGHWNVANISPHVLDTNYNEWVSRVLVRINEAANLHDMSKWAFNERIKDLIAGNPEFATVNQKYGAQYDVRNHCGVIITTNHALTGIYIPPDDRRYDVIESATKLEMDLDTVEKVRAYFGDLWGWFNDGGKEHIVAFLLERDLKGFCPNSGQRKTAAHQMIVAAGMATDDWCADALALLNEPDVVKGADVMAAAEKNGARTTDIRRSLSAAMNRLGYIIYPSQRPDRRWKIDGKCFTIFVKTGTAPARVVDEMRKMVGGTKF